MFYKYEFRKINNKDVLYLYLSSTSEESDEFINNKNENIENKIKRFIKQNNLKYNNGDVYIISNGIIIKSINIKDKIIETEKEHSNNSYSNEKYIIKVKYENKIIKINIKEYLISALLTNIDNVYDKEVLKSITILYRTYLYKVISKVGYIKNNDEFIKFKHLSYYKLTLYKEYNNIIKLLTNIVNETDSIFMTYNNNYINPYIHKVNNGKTETSNISYLTSVNSLWDLESPIYNTINKYKRNDISKLLNIKDEELNNIKILEITNNNCISKIMIGKKILSGDEFKEKLNLPSKDITILIDENIITFITRGNGNNLGLSIEGSKKLSETGCNYLQILNYYYPKCKIKKYI